MRDSRRSIAHDMANEAERAADNFEPFHNTHEGIAVILEEYRELETEVFRKQSDYDMDKMRKEAIHLGAMALRFIYDLIPLKDK